MQRERAVDGLLRQQDAALALTDRPGMDVVELARVALEQRDVSSRILRSAQLAAHEHLLRERVDIAPAVRRDREIQRVEAIGRSGLVQVTGERLEKQAIGMLDGLLPQSL